MTLSIEFCEEVMGNCDQARTPEGCFTTWFQSLFSWMFRSKNLRHADEQFERNSTAIEVISSLLRRIVGGALVKEVEL